MTRAENNADVIVVGAGPGGSTTAYHMAQHGLNVLMLEKSEFPREKVCGDGLTPRAVKQLVKMQVDVNADGWMPNKGLRVIGGGMRMEMDWPDLSSFPNFGLTRTRLDFDEILVRRAQAVGARLKTSHTVTGPVVDERSGRVTGVSVSTQDGASTEYHAPLVIAADGVSGRFPIALGLNKREDRPIGVAVRQYYRCPAKHDDEYLESWLELSRRGEKDQLLPGYGWIFGLGDGRVNVGLGVLNSSSAFGKTNYKQLLLDWLAGTPADWGMNDQANADGPVTGAALPMGFNRVPHYTNGVLLVGDSGGMVNPFNGEGIAYAMESGELAAEISVDALSRTVPASREQALRQYSTLLKARYGGYYRLGGIFVKLIGRPQVMRLATKHGLPHPMVMRFMFKLLANLTDPRGGDAMDRIINGLSRLAPAV